MKLLRRNLSTICYCLYKGREPILDEDGHETGETRILYQRPKRLRSSVSPAAASAQAYLFEIGRASCRERVWQYV